MFEKIKSLVKGDSVIVLENNSNTTLTFEENKEVIILNNVSSDATLDIEVKNNANVKLIEICLFTGDALLNKNIRCLENGKLEVISFELSTNLNSKAFVKTYLDEGSYITNKKISLFANNSHYIEDVYLEGKNSNFTASNVYVNYNNGTQDVDYTVTHNNVDTVSELFNYGICKNKSILNINTNGVVLKDAVRSDLKQKTKGVLIDLESSISANPLLKIDEYDCLASHGAGIGAIDEEDLYYLMSRGLSRQDSSKLIIAGFTYPVIDAFPDGEIKEFVIETINKYL